LNSDLPRIVSRERRVIDSLEEAEGEEEADVEEVVTGEDVDEEEIVVDVPDEPLEESILVMSRLSPAWEESKG
jgi:hypothetical protein